MHKLRATILGGDGHPTVTTATPKRPAAKGASLGASLAAIPVKRETSRITHQRVGDRLPGVMADTVLTLRRRKFDAAVINISSDGMMIEGEWEAHIGDKVGVALPDGSPGKAVVRWIRGDRLGLEFDGFSLEIGRTATGDFAFRRDTQPKRRVSERAPRKTLVWTATLHADTEMAPAKLRNISATGAQLDCPLQLAPDTKVTLSLGGAGFMPSTVRWCEGGRIGLSFARKFDVEMLTICADQDPAMRAIEWVKPEYLNADSPWAARYDDKFTIADLK